MAFLLGGLAIINGAITGINDGTGGNKLRKAICNSTKTITTLNDNFNKILNSDYENVELLENMFTDNLQKIQEHNKEIAEAKKNFNISKNSMIIASMLFVISIVISLVFKKFGVFDLIYNSIFGK